MIWKRIGAGVPPGLQIRFAGDWQHLENAANPLIFLSQLIFNLTPVFP
jgi:hypothetical protein